MGRSERSRGSLITGWHSPHGRGNRMVTARAICQGVCLCRALCCGALWPAGKWLTVEAQKQRDGQDRARVTGTRGRQELPGQPWKQPCRSDARTRSCCCDMQ